MVVTRVMTNAFEHRTLPDIFYEDPEPVEDGLQQASHIHRVTHLLTERYQDRPDVFVSNGGFVNYDVTNGNRRVAPDLYIAFDVDVAGIYANLPNFWVWEIGKALDFVLEVASPSTAANDLGPKRALYESLGVLEYWRLDPTGGRLYGQPIAGDRLAGGAYEACAVEVSADGAARGHSELLGLDFAWDGREFDLLDPHTGRTIDKLTAAQERVEAAEERAKAEEAARQAAEERVRQLEEQLRRAQGQQP